MMPSAGLMIVTEGLDDVHLLRMILHNDLTGDMRFYAGQGRASLATVARNLLVHEGGPVLLVMDAETLSPHLRQELESMAMLAMSGVAAPGLFQVFTFVPEIEVVFFESPAALARALGGPMSPATIEEGQLAPKKTLTQLLKGAKIPDLAALLRKLDEPAIETLAQGSQARAMTEKVRALCRFVTVPTS